MIKDITLGQYYPGKSLIHKLDSRLKIMLMFLYIFAIFLVKSYIVYVFIFLYLVIVIRIAKIPIKLILKGLRPLKWILLITFIINLFFIPGHIIFKFGFLVITEESLVMAIAMNIRLIFLIVGTSLLTLTTSPTELTDGIESLLNPFKKIGIPAHEIGIMMTIALRFIPTLTDETDKIIKAQMARGADFESGNIVKRSKNLVPLLVPLFINSLRRADELAIAMESRCYKGGEGRTRLHQFKLTKQDYYVTIINLVLFVFIVIGKFI